MGEYTPKWGLYKPAIGETGWGDKVNQNFDILDANLFTLKRFIDILLDPNIIFIYKNPPTEADLRISGTGGYRAVEGQFELYTSSNAGSVEVARTNGLSCFNLFTPDGGMTPLLNKLFDYPIRAYFLVSFQTSTNTDQIFWIVMGDFSDYSTNPSNTAKHIGIKVVNDTLYATVADGTNEYTKVLFSPVSASGFMLQMEIKFYPVDRVEFKGVYSDLYSPATTLISETITSNLPSGAPSYFYYPLYMSVYNGSTAETKSLYISKWLFAQAINADDIM